jgi:hypothetical protein
VEVYVWHTDALGFYSGFDDQDPNQTYSGGFERTVQNADRFCRGVQVTDDDGIVVFRTLYPGWYNGRAIHIHFVALRPGSGPGTMSYRGRPLHHAHERLGLRAVRAAAEHERDAHHPDGGRHRSRRAQHRDRKQRQPALKARGHVRDGLRARARVSGPCYLR